MRSIPAKGLFTMLMTIGFQVITSIKLPIIRALKQAELPMGAVELGNGRFFRVNGKCLLLGLR